MNAKATLTDDARHRSDAGLSEARSRHGNAEPGRSTPSAVCTDGWLNRFRRYPLRQLRREKLRELVSDGRLRQSADGQADEGDEQQQACQ